MYADTQDPESPLVMGNADVLRIPMKELYNVLTSVIPFDDRTILLLYYLIHGNSLFISYPCINNYICYLVITLVCKYMYIPEQI